LFYNVLNITILTCPNSDKTTDQTIQATPAGNLWYTIYITLIMRLQYTSKRPRACDALCFTTTGQFTCIGGFLTPHSECSSLYHNVNQSNR